jgi:hypothetical protein
VAYLLSAQDLVDGWQAEQAGSLIALASREPERVRAWLGQEETWERALAHAQLLALQASETPLSGEATADWNDAATSLKQATETLSTATRAVDAAIASLPKPEDEALRDTLKSRLPAATPEVGQGAPRSRAAWWIVGGVAAVLVLGLGVIFIGLLVALSRRRRRVAQPAPAPTAPAPSTVGLPVFLTGLRDASGNLYRFGLTCTRIGAADDNDVVLPLRGMSRHHARVWRTETGDCWIEDLMSTNGVHVAGEKVDRAWLTLGATVHLGAWEFTVV